MLHCLSMRLPQAYRRKGERYVGIAFFQDSDNLHVRDVQGVADVLKGKPLSAKRVGNPFWELLARTSQQRHPTETRMYDAIGGAFALIWLTDDELSSAPTEPPEIIMPPEPTKTAWAPPKSSEPFSLVERVNDPNAGVGPTQPGYTPWDRLTEEVRQSLANGSSIGHLGGTAFPVQDTPPTLSPCFLELADGAGGANFGGGTAQLDLERATIHWACD